MSEIKRTRREWWDDRGTLAILALVGVAIVLGVGAACRVLLGD